MAPKTTGCRFLACLLLLLLLGVQLVGCGNARLKDKTQVLERSVRSVCNYIRWGQWDRLQSFMRKPEVDKTLQQDDPTLELPKHKPKQQPLADMRVIECENLSIDAADNLDHAQAIADIQFHTGTTISILKLRYVQHWWQHKDTGRWYLGSDIPDFCGAMRGRHKDC